MKKKLLLIILISSFNTRAQVFQNFEDYDKNGLKFNFSYLFTETNFNLIYERRLKSFNAVGASFVYRKDDNIVDSTSSEDDLPFTNFKEFKFHLLGYYRNYLGSIIDFKGLFAELNTGVGYSDYKELFDDREETHQEYSFSVGATLGYKFMNRDGFLLEFILGGGLNTVVGVYPRYGFVIGKSF